MPVSPTYPGVYVQEVPSGVRTIVGVPTSVAMFLGMAKQGPINDPIHLTTYTDFVNKFSDDTTLGSLPDYVKLFFLNGGSDCWVMRIANGATQASVTLENEAGQQVLVLTAKDPGRGGELIRAIVTYNGLQPEATFNLEVFQWVVDAQGNRRQGTDEIWKGLSMDPASPLFAPDYLTQNSTLVTAALGGGVPAPVNGFSLSGRSVDVTGGFGPAFTPILAAANQFQISINGSPWVDIDISAVAVTTPIPTGNAIAAAIQNRFAFLGLPPVAVNGTFPVGPANHRRLQIDSAGDVYIRTGRQPDLAVPMMLGTANGGIEVSARAAQRPAANGITFDASDPTALNALAGLQQNAFTGIQLDMLQTNGSFAAQNIPLNLVTGAPTSLILTDANATSPNGNSDGVREKLNIIAQTINNFAATPPAVSKWRAEVWGSRLAIIPTAVDDNFIESPIGPLGFQVTPASLNNRFTLNVKYYTVGVNGTAGLQVPAGVAATDGTAPHPADYDNAYPIIDKQVDIFNLMVLPPDATVPMVGIYPNASVFCQQRRAFLLMDPPPSWTDAQTPFTGVPTLGTVRIGLVKDYSALFYPRILVAKDGKNMPLGPTGAIAGLCARIDGTRGVWKAPAGTEADLRGISGVERRFSDRENGILNPRAINIIRAFPEAIVNWGARTNFGDDDTPNDYKYIPIRRLALYIEESLYRGLKWVVFEPNDEPLWAQIRLNVGSFMHGLFRNGAFQGTKATDAYFVKCDSETTTHSDQNLGIVNIWVGFAPLKPAEFVILYLQQMAAPLEV